MASERRQKFSARRDDPKTQLSFDKIEAGKQQSFIHSTNVRMSSPCRTPSTNSDVKESVRKTLV